MSRELWLLRHAKSDRDTIVPDIDRPLKKRGERAADKIGAWMRRHELIPDRILSSPAERAITTASRVCHELGIHHDAIIRDDRLYASDVESIRCVLSECPADTMRVLLVGHNPEFEEFLIEMVGMENLPIRKKLMPTAALARMEIPGDWTQWETGKAKLLGITYAKALFDGN
jgi:phosphohistidine phosphatase